MAVEWNKLENQANNNNPINTSASTFGSGALEFAKDIIGGVTPAYVTPQDYFNGDKAVEAQMSMWERMNGLNQQIQDERNQHYNQMNSMYDKFGSMMNTMSQYNNTGSGNFHVNYSDDMDDKSFLYSKFREGGLNHNQALGLIANIQAENSFNPDDLYKVRTMSDGSNRDVMGFFNWQGGREVELKKDLINAGLYDPKTRTITRGREALGIMAQHAIRELKSGKEGNYLNFTSANPIDYARYANKVFVRSNQKASVLAGREQNYAHIYGDKRNWEQYLTAGEQYKFKDPNYVINHSADSLKGKAYDWTRMNYGGIMTGSFFEDGLNPLITSGFGQRTAPVAGASTWHPAIDIGVQAGTKILNPFAEAVVYEVGSDAKAGNYVTLQDRKTGAFLQLLHGSNIKFGKGRIVKRGDHIFTSGSSGIGSGAHLDARVFTRDGYAIAPDGTVSPYRHKRLGRN